MSNGDAPDLVERSVRLAVLTALLALPAVAGDLVVYDDVLATGFQDWSWAEHDLANPSPVTTGSASIAFEPDGWEGCTSMPR